MAKSELKKETSELIITLTADKVTWKEAQEKAFKKLANELSLKGYRKGHVPLDIAKKSISQSEIFSQALKGQLDVLVQEAAKHVDESHIILAAPSYKIDKISDAELEVSFVYAVYPEITLGEYKGLDVKYEEKKSVDKEVEEEIKKIMTTKVKKEPKTTGDLQKGEIAVFDFEGFVDGKAFPGGKAEKHELEIGSGQFIPGFEDQMIGLKTGESKDIKVVFPKDYHAKELAGKEATFKIKLHSILSKITPEITDEVVKELKVNGVETIEGLKKYVKNYYIQQFEQEARSKFQREAFAKLRQESKMTVPLQILALEMQQEQKKFTEQLKKNGMDINRYLTATGQTTEQMNAIFRSNADEKLRNSFIFAEISKKEKLEATEKDYEEAYTKYAKLTNQTPEAVKQVITKAQFQGPIINDKVLDLLIKEAKK